LVLRKRGTKRIRKAGTQEKMIPELLLSSFNFARESFCLEFFLFRVKRNRSLKPAEKFPPNNRSQMSGNPV
jgi:hypothetical protein